MLINKANFANNRLMLAAKFHFNLFRMLIAVYLRTLCSPINYKCPQIHIFCEFSGPLHYSRRTVIRGTEFAFELSLKYKVFILLLSCKSTLSTIRQATCSTSISLHHHCALTLTTSCLSTARENYGFSLLMIKEPFTGVAFKGVL